VERWWCVEKFHSRVITSPPVLPAGTAIGTYRIVKEIGHGAMGTVYLGEHTLLGRSTAIKVLRPLLSTDAEMVKRFFNEARALTRIADPGIVQIFDFGHHTDGNAFIVMELLDGEPMDRRLKRVGRFGPIECLRLLRMICTSLGVAHAKGIVHRDLKPENIFIVDDPAASGGERTKILDFGIAKLSGDESGKLTTRADVLMGTPMYMSPEQCRGGGDVDHRADIYAIGCVMFTMLTRRPPFDGLGSGDLIVAHLNEPPPLASSRVPDLPAILDEILQKCLQKSPARRFQSMAELVRALGSAGETLYGWSAVVSASEPPDSAAASTSSPPLDTQVPAEPGIPSPTLDWNAAALSGRTTLHDVSGEATRSIREPQRGGRTLQRWSVGVVAVTVSIIAAIALVALHSGSDAKLGTARPLDVDRSAPVEPRPSPAIVDTMPAPETPPASVAGNAAVAPAPSSDAGISSAAPESRAKRAAAPPPVRPKPGRTAPGQPSRGGGHDRPEATAAPPHIERTD
jgi:serine/threonine protein kinase